MGYSSETAEDVLFWTALTMSGIIKLNNTCKTAQKFSTVAAAFILISALHVVSINLTALVATLDKSLFAYSILYLLSISLWRDLFAKRKKISDFLRNIHRLKKALRVTNKKHSLLIFAIMSSINLAVVLVSTLSLYLLECVDADQLYFTFSRRIDNVFLHYVLQICGVIFVNLLVLYIPCMASLTLGVLEYRFCETLTSYNSHLGLMLVKNATSKPVRLSRLFSSLTGTSEELRGILSVPLLLLTSCSFLGFFIGIHNITLSDGSAPFIMETAVLSLSACSAIFSQGIFGSLMAEKMKTIQTTAGKIVVECNRTSFREKNLYYITRIEKKKITNLTACGVFELNRGFILHAFGAILTYSLLIINLN